MKRDFLLPKELRRGKSTILFVSKMERQDGNGFNYWLGIYHELVDKVDKNDYEGTSEDYACLRKVSISGDFYMAFLEEATRNKKELIDLKKKKLST